MAFRETFFISFARRYYPVMRGLIIIDHERRQVRIVGLCNWNVPCLTLSLIVITAILPKAAPMLLSPPCSATATGSSVAASRAWPMP